MQTGIEVLVTIPLADHQALLRDRDELARLRTLIASGLPVQRESRLSDPEITRFLTEHLAGGMTLAAARTACIAQFGAARAPSASAVHRYWQKLRTMAEHGVTQEPPRRPDAAHAPKVRAFLDECYEANVTAAATAREAEARFRKRAPSAEAIRRYFFERRLQSAREGA